jgi:hypothetical protein
MAEMENGNAARNEKDSGGRTAHSEKNDYFDLMSL